jgi:hypothetical protein
MEEQSGGEFAPGNPTKGAQNATLQEPRQKFLSTHAAVYNTFNVQRHIALGRTHRTFRAAAMNTRREAVAFA